MMQQRLFKINFFISVGRYGETFVIEIFGNDGNVTDSNQVWILPRNDDDTSTRDDCACNSCSLNS